MKKSPFLHERLLKVEAMDEVPNKFLLEQLLPAAEG